MAASDSALLSKLFYYGREKLYNTIQNTIVEVKEKYGSDPVLSFFDGVSLLMQDHIPEAMRELSSIGDHRDLVIAASFALIMAHRKARIVDKEAVSELETRIKHERSTAGEKNLYFAGLFLVLCGRPDKGRDYFNRLLKITNGKSLDGIAMLGWCELLMKKTGYQSKALKYFKECTELPGGSKDINTLVGLAKCHAALKRWDDALDSVNQAVVQHPKNLPCLLEKMNVLLAIQDWEQAYETSNRILAADSNCIQAKAVTVLYMLCLEGKYSEVAQKLGELVTTMDRFEPAAHQLYHLYSAAFSRLCGRHNMVLQQTITLLERAMSISHDNSLYYTEMGNQLMMQGKVGEAKKCFKKASTIDESSMLACLGGTRCLLAAGSIEDAASQLDFLHEISATTSRPAELMLLRAQVSAKQGVGEAEVLQHLNDAIEIRSSELENEVPGCEYFIKMDPDFLLQIVELYLTYAPSEPQGAGQVPSAALGVCSNILSPVIAGAPGMLSAVFLLAKVKYLSGQKDGAKALCQECLNRDVSYGDAHLLMARISLIEGNHRQAVQSLEIGLSYNFELMESPVYHYVQACVQKERGDDETCLKTLKQALKLFTKDKGSSTDKIAVYLELIEVNKKLGFNHEAAKIMQDAINEFQNTPNEIRIAIANADLSVARGDYESALVTLKKIEPDKPHYNQARKKLANIYFKHRKDKKMYISCFQDLVDQNPSPENIILLGDAYMQIIQPDKAISVYESALKKNPRDAKLASKIGKAFVKTHNYNKAINYYETALKQTPTFSELRYDLADLLIKLKSFEKAERILKTALEGLTARSDLPSLIEESKYCELLGSLAQKRGQLADALDFLKRAGEGMDKVVKRASVENSDKIDEFKKHFARLSMNIAEHYCDARDFPKAMECYRDALAQDPDNVAASLALANLHISTGELEECQNICSLLLQKNPQDEQAIVVLANVLFQRSQHTEAIYHFQQLLKKRPDNFTALSTLIDLLRRAGKAEESTRFLEMAERSSAKIPLSPGFNYCKGLHAWYGGNSHTALKHFNLARKDSAWGEKAVLAMIWICLNPDNDTLGGEVFANSEPERLVAERKENDMLSVKAAEKLLHDLRPTNAQSAMKVRILENYCLIATQSKQNVERALDSFMEVVATQSDHVPALLGSAIAFMILKQVPRARNQLKRIAKMQWNPIDAEEFEKAWLLLADIYIINSKYDMAQDLLKKCIQHNQACFKAWEYHGYVNEKEASYKDAAINYERAWQFSNFTNPTIGFKLGFNYLKAKRFVDAIDVCHKVLNHHPNYPKIRKEILEKARANIRV